MLPSFFIAHGSPMLAVETNEYTRLLARLGRILPRPRAVVLFSAHWESPVQKISNVSRYETIYDFGGFPDILYQITYDAKGHGETAQEIGELLRKEGIPFEMDLKRGLDHGAWVPLKHIYPDADIPVVAMSVYSGLPPEEQFRIGKALSSLRNKDVLIIGSGGTVHNLGLIRWNASQADFWAVEFDDWLKERLDAWDTASLFQYRTQAPHAQMAVPPYGSEHFVPLLYAMGAADDGKQSKLLYRGYTHGNLSHTVWQFG